MNITKYALPWFPLTSGYIDKYLDGVLLYLKNESESPSGDTLSLQTTIDLLEQRTRELYEEYTGQSAIQLDNAEKTEQELTLALRILSAYLCIKYEKNPEWSLRIVSLIALLITACSKEYSVAMSCLVLKCLGGKAITQLSFSISDVINWQISGFAQIIQRLVIESRKDVSWFNGQGFIKVQDGEMYIFDNTRAWTENKEKIGGKFHKDLCISEFPLFAMTDRKEKKSFTYERFIASLQSVPIARTSNNRLRGYSNGDELTVKVLSKTSTYAEVESIDTAYESVRGKLFISRGGNVRGISLTDLIRNLTVGDMFNVRFMDGSFDVYDTILDFINGEYQTEDSLIHNEEGVRARLIFPSNNNCPNTWCTEAGFHVRTKWEDMPRGITQMLSILEYDYEHDWIIAEVLDSKVSGFTLSEETESKNRFLRHCLQINTELNRHCSEEDNEHRITPRDISVLHRTLSLRQRFFNTSDRDGYFAGCRMLAVVANNLEDEKYYHIKEDYSNVLLQFAMNNFSDIHLDCRDIDSDSVIMMDDMVDILSEYGKTEESQLLNERIRYGEDSQLSAVSKLVQAANRFQGNPFLSRLHKDLHREICVLLDVSDAIIEPTATDDAEFPFEKEGPSIEHKMSWIYDNDKNGEINEKIQSGRILKTICAFLNDTVEDAVGHVYIGTDEKRRYISGIQKDIYAFADLGYFDLSKDLCDQYLQRLTDTLNREFPDCTHCIRPSFICNGKVLDIRVSPSESGVVYFNDIPYERFGSSSREMSPDVMERIKNKKFLQHYDLAQKIESIRKAIYRKSCVILKDYYSSHSNTERDRKLEVFDFTDSVRRDEVWAFDPYERMNKVFSLKRASGVQILEEKWKYEKKHQTQGLDIIGFYGTKEIPLAITINSIRAKNVFIESFPNAKTALEKIPGENRWSVSATLFTPTSLDAVCSFYLGYSEEVDISRTPELIELAKERVEKLMKRIS